MDNYPAGVSDDTINKQFGEECKHEFTIELSRGLWKCFKCGEKTGEGWE